MPGEGTEVTGGTFGCPMHSNVVSDRPGLCPECGMNLVPGGNREESRHTGLDKHKGHSTNIFRTRFWVSLALSVPVLLYADIVQELFDFTAPLFRGASYVPFALASVIFVYGGSIFLTSAYRELRARLPGMMTLIALAIVTAYSYSVYVTFIGEGKTLFWELATLITVMLLGHWMEMRAVSGAQSALKELSKLLPEEADVMRDGTVERVALADVRVGDRLLVKPGGRIPADGTIEEGHSDVDESIVTGESKPVGKRPGDSVIAGTVNGDGALTVVVTSVGEGTFLSGVMRLVAEAQASKSRLQALADRAAYFLTIVAVIVGGSTLVWWLSVADTAFAFERMVAVLVIACPHALGLAIPLVAAISTTKAARNGFLVKQRLALETARDIDIVLFDKTGTLTEGSFGVDRVIAASGIAQEDVLRYAASVNSRSEHPIAKAVVAEATRRNITLSEVRDFRRIPGKGVRAFIDGTEVMVGSRVLALEQGKSLPSEVSREIDALTRQGKTLNFIIVGGKILGAIALTDVIREASREAVTILKNMNVKTAMITGDSDDVARWVADELGIDTYFARVLPDEKADKVKLLQSQGQRVAMVGDGINDAPALAQADLGIAIGAGTNVAIESAGIILVRNDPRDIAKVIELSRATYRKMLQNLFWATGYNVIAIPLAAGVLFSRGIVLQPALAAILMSVSTVIVALNAVALRGQKLT